MPHFSDCCDGYDTYICQVCGKIYCSGCQDSVWMKIPGKNFSGNVCPGCVKQPMTREQIIDKRKTYGIQI